MIEQKSSDEFKLCSRDVEEHQNSSVGMCLRDDTIG
jgi:hypothetical protein